MISTHGVLAQVKEDQYRLDKQPQWVRLLVSDLARRLEIEARAAAGARAAAEVEVSAAREALTQGPADSDTYMDLPRSVIADDEEQRPLGRGVNIEFREPDMESGEGISVKMQDGSLHVHGINHIVVIPVNQTYIKIETR